MRPSSFAVFRLSVRRSLNRVGTQPQRANAVSTCNNVCVQNLDLLDRLVGAGEQRWRHLYAERLGGFQIDNHVESRWLLGVVAQRAFNNAMAEARPSQNIGQRLVEIASSHTH